MTYKKNRNYGLYVGDRAKRLGLDDEVTVIGFFSDNNKCLVETAQGETVEAVCEWIERIPPEGYLDFRPLKHVEYTVVIEELDALYPTVSVVSGELLYEYVARVIYNQRKFTEEDFKRVMIYFDELQGVSLSLYQVFEARLDFEKAIDAYIMNN